MQNNAVELSQKLLRSLDDNYNVIDMPTVLEVISVLEKISLSKELLQSSRLGKYVNEVRRNTTDDHLAKRTRDLVKRWRNEFIAESNGQLKQSAVSEQSSEGSRLKRPAKDCPTGQSKVLDAKRLRLNGNNELDLSDNSNSSFKDALNTGRNSAELIRKDNSGGVIVVNSDSNSSVPEAIRQDPTVEQQLPKKRGRKKGSKNHKSLLDEAETSFSNKMAVSRGNAKVKTTQELVASLQSRNNSALGLQGRTREDLNEKAAKLTEMVSMIDQKLYSNNSSNFRRKRKVLDSGTVTNIKEEPVTIKKEEEIIVVDEEIKVEEPTIGTDEKIDVPKALSVEEALRALPPVDQRFLDEADEETELRCTCVFEEGSTEFVESPDCPAKFKLTEKYDLDDTSDDKVKRYLSVPKSNLNGNYSLGPGLGPPEIAENGLYRNVVPKRSAEKIPKWTLVSTDCKIENPAWGRFEINPGDDSVTDREGSDPIADGTSKINNVENNLDSTVRNSSSSNSNTGPNASEPSEDIKRYRFSEDPEDDGFREWHEVVETESYNGEVIRILPYVVVD